MVKNAILDGSLYTPEINTGDSYDPQAQMFPGYFSYLFCKRKRGASVGENITLTLQGQVCIDDSGPSRIWYVTLLGVPPAAIATVTLPTNEGNNVVIDMAFADGDILDLLITGDSGTIILNCVNGPILELAFCMWQQFIVPAGF